MSYPNQAAPNAGNPPPGQNPGNTQNYVPETCCFCIPIDPAQAHANRGGPVMTAGPIAGNICPICEGQGNHSTRTIIVVGDGKFDKPCRQGDIHYRAPCPGCRGSGQLVQQPGVVHQFCTRCQGRGGIDAFDKGCLPESFHYKHPCAGCGGRGLLTSAMTMMPAQQPVQQSAGLGGGIMGKLGGLAGGLQVNLGGMLGGGQPQAQPGQMMVAGGPPVACPICTGQGHFDNWGKPCRQNSAVVKGPCHACNGSGQLQQPFSTCIQCQGKGGLDTFKKPVLRTDMMFKQVCAGCGGRGVVFPNRI